MCDTHENIAHIAAVAAYITRAIHIDFSGPLELVGFAHVCNIATVALSSSTLNQTAVLCVYSCANWIAAPFFICPPTEKQRRLKQAKEQAQDEVEKYRQERERQFKDFEAKHMGSKEGVAAKIDVDTRIKIDEMNRQQAENRAAVIDQLLSLVYDLKPELHRNYALQLREQKHQRK